jgi:hypothetical protein
VIARQALLPSACGTSRYAAKIAFGLPFAILGMCSAEASQDSSCQGHQLLVTARPAGSCTNLLPLKFRSPDGKLTALVFPVDPSLNATPDMESRVEIYTLGNHVLASKDYSSPRGANGYYVVHAKWTPDSKFFVYTMSSSGGHSPWSFPMWAYGRNTNAFVRFSDLIGGNPTMSPDFQTSGHHTVTAITWRDRNIEKTTKVTVDLKTAIAKSQR